MPLINSAERDEGLAAFVAGRRRDENPYDGTKAGASRTAWYDWDFGWNRASMEARVASDNTDTSYVTRSAGDGTYDVVQKNSGIVIARGAGPVTAQRVVNTLSACPFVMDLNGTKPKYKPLTKDCGSPTGTHNFFLVRVTGIHPASGKKYIPSPVQLIDDQLYSSDNEIEPLTWSLNGDIMQGPTNDPYQANLEWMLPPDND